MPKIEPKTDKIKSVIHTKFANPHRKILIAEVGKEPKLRELNEFVNEAKLRGVECHIDSAKGEVYLVCGGD